VSCLQQLRRRRFVPSLVHAASDADVAEALIIIIVNSSSCSNNSSFFILGEFETDTGKSKNEWETVALGL
jgi:hypothetical protein